MQTMTLSGQWLLTGNGAVEVPSIPVTVPGNIEIALTEAGIVPDPFFGTNVDRLKPFEFNNWVYTRTFHLAPDFPAAADLVFEGIDCVAEILVNGKPAGNADNAFIRHRFAVDTLLKRGEENTVTVRIQSPILAVKDIPLDHLAFCLPYNYAGLMLRKPAHSYGWDIAPRMLLGGLWRDVRLEERPAHQLERLYIDTLKDTNAGRASLSMSWSFHTTLTEWDDFDIELTGRCGDSQFRHCEKRNFTAGWTRFEVPHPKLWYPAGYGEANLYDVTFRVSYHGESLLCEHRRIGIRTVKLDYDETPGNFRFRFEINHIPVMIKGSNWVPADALHGRDAAREIPILKLFTELGCNMLRVWGGGVYGSPAFYRYCDEHGILVWQDFMMACAINPQDEAFLAKFRIEVEYVVNELRQHPSLALWAGDNEVDQMCAAVNDGRKPNRNRLTREIIPQVLDRLDPGRPYLPSSPYISPGAEALGHSDMECPEQHVWGPRDYFKSPFYADNPAAFISEIGYHGAPAVESLRKFLSPDKLWPGRDNPEWIAHSTLYAYRVELMYNQIRELFGFEPATLEEFVEASQAVQAEAKKFFIENTRAKKWAKAGIIWWNVMDCWPQLSDAVVDYYFNRKAAFDYIRRSQKPLQIIVGEWRNWGHEVIITNDTLSAADGTVKITDADTGECLFEGPFHVDANANAVAGQFKLSNGDRRLLLLHLEAGAYSVANHYFTGRPPLDFAKYRSYRETIAALG